MAHRRTLLLVASLLLLAGGAPETSAEVYLTVKEAPGAVFPEADSFERKDIQVTEEFRGRLKRKVGRAKPSIWEPFYISFIAQREGKAIGYAVICEEIGKHRPITFIVGVTLEGKVKDVAIMMYRESVGSEVRYKGFLAQFQGKKLQDPMRPYRDIRNVSGATLSVRALTRGVRKALAVIQLAYLETKEDR